MMGVICVVEDENIMENMCNLMCYCMLILPAWPDPGRLSVAI